MKTEYNAKQELTLFDPAQFGPFKTRGGGADLPPGSNRIEEYNCGFRLTKRLTDRWGNFHVQPIRSN